MSRLKQFVASALRDRALLEHRTFLLVGIPAPVPHPATNPRMLHSAQTLIPNPELRPALVDLQQQLELMVTSFELTILGKAYGRS